MSILVNVHPSARAITNTGGPTVLVVDDEPLILELLERSLRLSGFQPIVARSGREALALYREHATSVSLVLLDVRMPDLSGPETMQALREIDPEVRCCFMSGDLGGYCAEELTADGALHLFRKPFSPGELAATLRRLTPEYVE